MYKTLKILIADDYELARTGLRLSLEPCKRFEIVGTVQNGFEAVQAAQKYRPDIILMDSRMPVMDGLTAAQQIKRKFPHIKIILLAPCEEPGRTSDSMAAGASAHCLKDIRMEKLAHIIIMVSEGASWFDPRLESPSSRMPGPVPTAPLSKREEEVLELLIQGKGNKQIAEILSISTHTVKVHVGNIMLKFEASSRAQVISKTLHRDGGRYRPLGRHTAA